MCVFVRPGPKRSPVSLCAPAADQPSGEPCDRDAAGETRTVQHGAASAGDGGHAAGGRVKERHGGEGGHSQSRGGLYLVNISM